MYQKIIEPITSDEMSDITKVLTKSEEGVVAKAGSFHNQLISSMTLNREKGHSQKTRERGELERALY